MKRFEAERIEATMMALIDAVAWYDVDIDPKTMLAALPPNGMISDFPLALAISHVFEYIARLRKGEEWPVTVAHEFYYLSSIVMESTENDFMKEFVRKMQGEGVEFSGQDAEQFIAVLALITRRISAELPILFPEKARGEDTD